MKTNYEIRYAAHPEDAKNYDTKRIRRDFLIEKVFAADEVNMVYSMYDRMVVGGAMPVGEALKLEAIDPLKAPYFTTRREIGMFNVGGPGIVKAGDETFTQTRPIFCGSILLPIFLRSTAPSTISVAASMKPPTFPKGGEPPDPSTVWAPPLWMGTGCIEK